MKNYDDLLEFDYTETEEWYNFLEDKIIPLHTLVSRLVKTSKFLEEEFNEKTLSDVFDKNQEMQLILLGGSSADGEYKNNSLAKIWKETTGVQINIVKWTNLKRETGINASNYVTCECSSTEFLEFMGKIVDLTRRILSITDINEVKTGTNKYKYLMENPKKIVEYIREIYERLVELSSNYNYHTFFIKSLVNVPKKYLLNTYPKLADKENILHFLGVEKDDSFERENYEIYHYKDNSIGKILCELNVLIWEFFSEKAVRDFFENFYSGVPNLQESYYKKINLELSEIGWTLPDYIGGIRYRRYFVSDGVVTHSGSGSSSRFYCEKLDNSITIFRLLDDLSPALFLKKMELEVKEPFVYEKNEVGADNVKIRFTIFGD